MTWTPEQRDEARRRRAELTPSVVAVLRELAAGANELAEWLERDPGEGIGLAYVKVRGPWERVDLAMTHYQNHVAAEIEEWSP